MKLLAKYKTYIFSGLAILAFCTLMFLFDVPCPVKYLTGISCAGCGMSRALLSALRLDLSAAFYYHPLWIAVIPGACLFAFFGANGKKRALSITLWSFGAVFVAVWLYRVFFTESSVVEISLHEGAIARLIEWISNVLAR